MDFNCKLGKKFILQDPHEQSANGKILGGIIERHGLVVANGLQDKRQGLITRRRETQNSVEQSIIDHVIVSEDLAKEIVSIKIDEEKNHAFCRIYFHPLRLNTLLMLTLPSKCRLDEASWYRSHNP